MFALSVTALLVASGCFAGRSPSHVKPPTVDYTRAALQMEDPDVSPTSYEEVAGPTSPRSIRDHESVQYRDMTLQEAIQTALARSKVMSDLGGTVLRSPATTPTTFDPAVQETDPQYGVEAALSAFDASFAANVSGAKNDLRYNNRFVGNLGFFNQDLDIFQAELSKRAVTGTQFAARQYIDYDANNNLGNQFPSAWNVYYEGEVRHPLLRGGGVEFNRTGGPSALPGIYNGVLVARVRTDISLADFAIGIRDLLSNVENAYWDLYFAYRDLDTKIQARNMALETWRRVNALYRTGRRGGEAEKEAQAREQFFRFQQEVENALVGRPVQATQTNNGSNPGTFRATPGVYVAERKLRFIIGLPPNDNWLIRPADEPPVSPVSFDWPTIAAEALVQREELRRQRWEVKRRELELIAAKNFLLPNLDFVGRYRYRGFGHELIDPDRSGKPQFDNAFMDLTSGKFQEWQMGMEFSVPIGFRQGHTAVRNAELNIMRARALLREQELQIAHDLSTAVSEADRAYTLLQTEINRLIAAKQQLDALQAAYEADKVEFFVVLDAQRRLAEAEDLYHQARVEYVVALRNVHYEKGTLLSYCGVVLGEGPWPLQAYLDAAQRERLRVLRLSTDYRLSGPNIVSQGPASEGDGSMPSPESGAEAPVRPAGPPFQVEPVPEKPGAGPLEPVGQTQQAALEVPDAPAEPPSPSESIPQAPEAGSPEPNRPASAEPPSPSESIPPAPEASSPEPNRPASAEPTSPPEPEQGTPESGLSERPDEVPPGPLEIPPPPVGDLQQPMQDAPEAPLPQPASAMPEAPLPQPSGAMPEASLPQPSGAMPEAPLPQPARDMPEAPSPQPFGAMPEAPLPQQSGAMPEASLPQQSGAMPEAPPPEPGRDMPEAPLPEPPGTMPEAPTPMSLAVPTT
jgi:hypothetical protein